MEILTHQLTEFFPDFLAGSAASGLPFLKISAQHDKKLYSEVIEKLGEYANISFYIFNWKR